MAERRMLHRKAAVSSDLSELRRRHGGDAVAFFHQLIPFYDRYGCVPDDPNKLRVMACPTWEDVTTRDVKRWVEWMVKRGMLVRIDGPNGDRGLRNPAFEEHQRGTKFEREAPSPYEPPSFSRVWSRPDRKGGDKQGGPDQVPTKSRPGPPKGKEGKGSKPSPSFPPSPFPEQREKAVEPAEGSALAPSGQPTPAVEGTEVNGNGRRRDEPVGADALLESISNPALRAAVERGRSAA